MNGELQTLAEKNTGNITIGYKKPERGRKGRDCAKDGLQQQRSDV